jgi:hydroxymethylpyrimidine/phosphomethylpyrimidine kinase
MLGTAETVCAVRDALEYVGDAPIVIDPVMIAESGAVLLDDAARQAMVDELLPLAAVITPNLPEARVLADTDDADAEDLARALLELGPQAVVITGGHREEATDVFFDGDELHLIPGERHADGAAHGSGCTHSSALAAHLALGHTPLEASRAARAIAGEAVRNGLRQIGRGAGPVDVFDLTGTAASKALGASGRPSAARRVT